MIRLPPRSTRTDTLFPYPSLFRSARVAGVVERGGQVGLEPELDRGDAHAFADVRHHPLDVRDRRHRVLDPARDLGLQRSEEHTSELQSLMRISYAVFCLKKKITLSLKQNVTQEHYTADYMQH